MKTGQSSHFKIPALTLGHVQTEKGASLVARKLTVCASWTALPLGQPV